MCVCVCLFHFLYCWFDCLLENDLALPGPKANHNSCCKVSCLEMFFIVLCCLSLSLSVYLFNTDILGIATRGTCTCYLRFQGMCPHPHRIASTWCSTRSRECLCARTGCLGAVPDDDPSKLLHVEISKYHWTPSLWNPAPRPRHMEMGRWWTRMQAVLVS